jgi:hypothetical protein
LQKDQDIEKTKEMQQFFMTIWNSLPPYRKRCYETGEALKNPPLSTYFHHVLPKSKYPEYRLCDWNIVLLKPEVHEQAELNINKTPKVKEYKQRLLNQITKL